MPEHTREKVYSTFQTVLREQRSISKNYKLELEDNTYYFKCIMYPYDDMVLCQYRDITQRSNVKRQLEQVNRNLREIQKVAQIGQWSTTPATMSSITWATPEYCARNLPEASLWRNIRNLSSKKTA